jgi:hypothetical protein
MPLHEMRAKSNGYCEAMTNGHSERSALDAFHSVQHRRQPCTGLFAKGLLCDHVTMFLCVGIDERWADKHE